MLTSLNSLLVSNIITLKSNHHDCPIGYLQKDITPEIYHLVMLISHDFTCFV